MKEYNDFIKIENGDCMDFMKKMKDGYVDMTFTDIPYGVVNRDSNGLRGLDKKSADAMTFDLQSFLDEVYRVTGGTIVIFCGKEQMSKIHGYFSEKQKKGKGTVRQIIWKKTNPSPMNGKYIYLSGIENAVWFKKRGATYNGHCKNTVFEYPNGRNKIHPTEKNHDLIKEILLDNTKENQIVFDPCMGSGSTGVVCLDIKRKFVGIEICKEWFEKSEERFENILYN